MSCVCCMSVFLSNDVLLERSVNFKLSLLYKNYSDTNHLAMQYSIVHFWCKCKSISAMFILISAKLSIVM